MSAHSITSRGLAGRKIPQGTLTPMGALLFAASEPGAWYDPSDMSTLFQDSAGSTPVTAVEQPVGRMLDKSGRGNHATQATTTKRPVLSRRVNLLTKTEGILGTMLNGAPTINANALLAPDGTMTATRVINNGAAATYVGWETSAEGAIARIFLCSDGLTTTWLSLFQSGHKVTNARVVSGPGAVAINSGLCVVSGLSYGAWTEVEFSSSTITSGLAMFFIYPGSTGAIPAGNGIGVWHPSLTLSTDAHLSYQWVNTATDYDADPAKFPAYLRFDGVDDALQTGNIDFTSTDKVTAWAGVLRTLTSSAQEICGLTASPVNAGAFTLWASTGAAAGVSNLLAAFSSTTSGSLMVAVQTLTGNTQAVLNGYQNSTGVNVRLNSGAISTVAAIPAANFANAPIYIGSRAGTSNFLNGRLYSLIVRGTQTPLSQIEATELYIKQKMRMP